MALRIESVREKASGTLEVAISGGLLFHFDSTDAQLCGMRFDSSSCMLMLITDDGSRLEFTPKAEVENEMLESLRRLDQLHAARKVALGLVARAEQASIQLYEKLAKKGFSKEAARIAVQWMCENGYVDDRRYVRLLLQSHLVRRGQGPERLKAIAWPRIGLFENPRIIFAEAFSSIEEESLIEAMRRSAENVLKRGEIPVGYRRAMLDDGNEENPAAPLSHSRKLAFLRSWFRHEGFPNYAIDRFLESWETENKDES
jgi:SOS response regulatory protein OraA/RecX